MVAAMTAGPEMPDFCCKTAASCGCQGYASGCQGYATGSQGYATGCYGYSSGCCNYGGGYGKACCFPGICNAFCNALSCLLCCGKGGGYGGGYSYGYGPGYGTSGNPYTACAQRAAEVNTRAEVIVRVPANAKLLANGQPTELTGEQRIFYTPNLTPGEDFKYNLAIDIDVDGKTKTIAKQISVRAGHRTIVDFVERASSEITVNL